jgi:biopolymer transport protein ExbD
MAMTTSSQGGRAAEMNVTPLIDVLLTLLVIFMIITPITPKGEKALIPQPPPKTAKPQHNNRSVVLEVLPGSKGQPVQLDINQQSVSWQDLPTRLVDIYKTRAQKVMFVKADNSIPWQDVATVIDEAHNAGVDKVGLITGKIGNSG